MARDADPPLEFFFELFLFHETLLSMPELDTAKLEASAGRQVVLGRPVTENSVHLEELRAQVDAERTWRGQRALAWSADLIMMS